MLQRSTSTHSFGQAAFVVSTTDCSAIMPTILTIMDLLIMIHIIIGIGHSMTHGTGIFHGTGALAGVASTGVILGAIILIGILTTTIHATTGRMLITTTTITSTMEDIFMDIISTDCQTVSTTEILQAVLSQA